MKNTVIILFTYNRVDLTQSVIESIKKNPLSELYDLIIYSDGPKKKADIVNVESVRDFISDIDGFNTVTVVNREENFGLAKSIISGVNEAFKTYEKVIVLEDDLILSTNFLAFMQQGLEAFSENQKVMNISGFSYNNNVGNGYDNFFWGRATSWGWATWKDRWSKINWELPYSSEKELKKAAKGFNKFGYDLTGMLLKQYRNEINSWAIRWCYHQHHEKLLSVVPAKSKVTNHGFGAGATHCVEERHIEIDFDVSNDSNFNFNLTPAIPRNTYKMYVKNYSILKRIKEKIQGKITK
ncbi:MAG: glycosyltransferase [Paraglaciecola sp.]|uniref:glycosyltransferase n=1 Tax=Paraglaciecola sp. TaxID=1920173 RepID=UPI003298DB4C